MIYLKKIADSTELLDFLLTGNARFLRMSTGADGVLGSHHWIWRENSTLVFSIGIFDLVYLRLSEFAAEQFVAALYRTWRGVKNLKLVYLSIPALGSNIPQALESANQLFSRLLSEKFGNEVWSISFVLPILFLKFWYGRCL